MLLAILIGQSALCAVAQSGASTAANGADTPQLTYTMKVLYNFCTRTNCGDGSEPKADRILNAAGNLYGTTEQGNLNDSGEIFKIDSAGNISPLYGFCSQFVTDAYGDIISCADGDASRASLIEDVSGNFFGTTTSEARMMAERFSGSIKAATTHCSMFFARRATIARTARILLRI
jgi:uncharacterized repeat protein (TIGR03803 family)